MKLLRQINENVSYSTNGVGSSKTYFIEGIFMQAEIVNRNGRKYPEKVLDAAAEEYIENAVSKNRAYGELNHPKDGSPDIDLERVSHLIVELRKEGTNWVGKAKILDTDKGKIVKAIIDGGGKLAVSSRALGSLKKENGIDIVEELKLTTAADIVVEPSAPDAYVDVITEGVEWVFDEKRRMYVPYPTSEVYQKKCENIKRFIYSLKNMKE
ncbi:MAG: primosomal protein [Patescibacteria group bacterium]|nr:primosomal protein [Patescibacteria group bacterium]